MDAITTAVDVVGAVLDAPLAAIGAIVVLITGCTIEVEREVTEPTPTEPALLESAPVEPTPVEPALTAS
jgi:hypothetical protein